MISFDFNLIRFVPIAGTGKIEGDTASGEIEVAGASGTFTGSRAK